MLLISAVFMLNVKFRLYILDQKQSKQLFDKMFRIYIYFQHIDTHVYKVKEKDYGAFQCSSV